jgi:hypothetical protein
MKYLKLFENHQTEAEIAKICEEYKIKNWSLNSDGLVDVNGLVFLSGKGLKKLPLKFGTITGGFDCQLNGLTTLEGAPHTVGDYFDCHTNLLTSLEGAPHTVGTYFDCGNNNLTSLEFAPKSVGSDFWCYNNYIRSFEGLVNIGPIFYCNHNPLKKIWDIISPKTDKWDSEKMEFFNDLDIIRGEEIAIERLNFFLEEMGLEPVERVEGYKNIY